MDLHPLAEPPRLRTLEASTRRSMSNEDGDIFMDLHARFTSKPRATLPVLELGDDFDGEIQSQHVYQTADTDVGPVGHSVDYASDDDEDSTGGDSEGRGVFGEDDASDQGGCSKDNPGDSPKGGADDSSKVDVGESSKDDMEESSNVGQEKSPRTLYTRGMGLSPSPSHVRLFPDSPLSTGGGEEPRGPDHEDDNDKENEAPHSDKDNTSEPRPSSPQHLLTDRRDMTVVYLPLPSSPLGESGALAAKQPLADQENELSVPLSPPPLASVEVLKRETKTQLDRLPHSKIPVRAAMSVGSPEVEPLQDGVGSLSSPRMRMRLPVSPTRPKARLRLPMHRQMKSDTGGRYIGQQRYSLCTDRSWQPNETDNNELALSFGEDTTRKETMSSFVHDWLHDDRRSGGFDKNLTFSSAGNSEATSPLQGENYGTITGHSNDGHGYGEVEHGTTLTVHKPQGDDDISLASPSTASQLSMPWNSAEKLAAQDITTFPPETRKPTPAPKKLPELQYSQGSVFVKFPDSVDEGLFNCYATVRIRVTSRSDVEGRSIDISCSASEMEKVVFNWGARSGPEDGDPPVPRVALVGKTTNTTKLETEDVTENADNPSEQETEGKGSTSKADQNQPKNQVESEIGGDPKRVLRLIADFVSWVQTHYNRLANLVTPFLNRLQRRARFAVDGARRLTIRPQYQLAILKHAVAAIICAAALFVLNRHCHLNSSPKKYSGSPGYYHPHSSSQLSFCEMWVRGSDAVQRRLKASDNYEDADLNAVLSEEMATWEGYKDESIALTDILQTQEITETEQDSAVTISPVEEHPTDLVSTEGESAEGAASNDQTLSHSDGEQPGDKAGDKTPSLRDQIDWLLGWKGPAECPEAGQLCPQ